MTEQPKEWRVENGAFIGFVLVDLEPETNAMGVKQKPREGWLPFAHDLRQVTCIRQRDSKHPEQTSLEHNGAFIGSVNVAFKDLLPGWVAAKDVYDEQRIDDTTGAMVWPVIREER